MAPSGELGGAYSDDTDMVGWWTPSILTDPEGFAPLARDCMTRMAAGVLKHTLYNGVNRSVTDPLHAYEEGQNLVSHMPLVFYGNPQYIEWLMTSIRTCDKWMYRTPEGALNWRVAEFGWRTAENPPAGIPAKVSGDADLMLHPHLILAWYNGNPDVIERIVAYTAGMPDPYVQRAYGGGASIHMAAYWFTGGPNCLHFPKKAATGDYSHNDIWAWFKRQPDAAVHAREAREQPWWPKWVGFYETRAGCGHMAWAVKQRRDILVKSLEHVLWGPPEEGGCERFFYMWTEAQLLTDRVFLPVQPVAQAMLGGYTVRNKLWPAYAVSYEGLGKDFAALVLDQGRDRLKLVMINLAEKPRGGAFRVWQLDPCRYELKAGPDANDDGAMDGVERTETLKLRRMDAVPVSLPPRKLMVCELRQVERLGDLSRLPDPAIGPGDVARDGSALKVTVHNIGNTPVRDLIVAVVDASGKPLATGKVGQLDAPLDLTPRTVVLDLRCPEGKARVVLDPENAVEEIAESNNEAPVPGK